MRQSVAFRIQDSVAINDLVPRVGQQQELRVDFVFGGFCENFLQVRLFIDGYGKNDCVRQRRLFQECFQLTKLTDAEGSPVAAIEHEDDVLFSPVA